VVEVETLRRWGRVPIGTRAVGQIVLVQHDFSSSPWVQYTIQIGEDPRKICASVPIGTFEGNLPEYALSRVVDALEGEDTPSGYQRFRVIRAEWTDAPAGADAGADADAARRPRRTRRGT
jgi:hypothetical protein